MSTAENREPFQPRKRLFIGLLTVACTCVLGLAFLLWWIPSVGLIHIHPLLPVLLGTVLAGVSLLIVGGLTLLIFTLLSGKDLFFSQRLRGIVIRYLFPGIISLGRLAGIDRDTLQQSFIALNNQLVRAKKLRVTPDRALILLPHCIQLFDCEIKVTGDINKCVQCGRCDIKGLVEIGRKYHIDISVATGGTLARKVIVEKRPKLVLAVACERDLTSGIKDCYPLPVIGILNDRPFGPCFNTTVDTAKIDEALSRVILVEEPSTAPS